MKKKKWIIVIAVIVVAIAAITVSWLFRSVSLEKKICDVLNGTENYRIVSMEEMQSGKDPKVIDLKDRDEEKTVEAIRNTTVKFHCFETGMEISSPLYTLTILSDDGQVISVTVDAENNVHINNTETSYLPVGESNLYQTMQEVFQSNWQEQ